MLQDFFLFLCEDIKSNVLKTTFVPQQLQLNINRHICILSHNVFNVNHCIFIIVDLGYCPSKCANVAPLWGLAELGVEIQKFFHPPSKRHGDLTGEAPAGADPPPPPSHSSSNQEEMLLEAPESQWCFERIWI